MENRYLYRAKRIDNGEWVEGFYCKWLKGERVVTYSEKETDCIITWMSNGGMSRYEIYPSTICQCTGLKDKNGKLIWENNICHYYNSEDGDGIGIIKNGYVLWKKGTISVKHKMTPLFYLQCHDEWEVIGNIFDNPELLEA